MTGAGFDTSLLGAFGMAWLGMVMLFFIIALSRKWIGEEMGVSFSFVGGLIGGLLPYFLIVFFTCSYKFGLLGGLIGAAIGSLALGNIIGESF
jgi:hypothetical protein